MIPVKGKKYLVHHCPDRSNSTPDYYFFGYGECLSSRSNGGLYTFHLSLSGEMGMFISEEILCEHQTDIEEDLYIHKNKY